MDKQTEQAMMDSIDPDTGEVVKTYWAEMPKSARWHRREARRLLVGKSGLTEAQKIERIQEAMQHLSTALILMAEGDD